MAQDLTNSLTPANMAPPGKEWDEETKSYVPIGSKNWSMINKINTPEPTTPTIPAPNAAPTIPAPNAAPYMIPAIQQESQSKVTSGVPISKELQNTISANQTEAQRVGKEMVDYAAAKAAIDAQVAEESRKNIEAEQIIDQKRNENKAAAHTDYKNQLDTAMKDVDQYKIDPQRLFGGSTWRTIGAAIAAGIGAYASTITGQPNFALSIIDKAIDRDVDAQKEELLKKKGKVGEVRNAYQDNLQRFKDEDVARAATKAQQRELVAQKYQENLAKMGVTPDMIEADKNVLSLKQSAAQEKMNLEALMAKKVENISSTTLAPKVVGLSPSDRLDKSNSAAKEFRDIIKDEDISLKASRNTLDLAKEARVNPAATAPLLTNFIRSFGGEKGALSEGDVQRMKLDPSLAGKSIDWISSNFTGTLSKDSIDNLEKAITGKIKTVENSIRAKGVKYGERMSRLGLDPVDIFDEHLPLIYSKTNEDKQPSQVLGGLGKKRTK
jgi:hypothetical protein